MQSLKERLDLNIRRYGVFTTALVVCSMAFVSCSSKSEAHESLSILNSDASSQEVPANLASQDFLQGDSIRYLGEYGDESLFVARASADPQSQVCLVAYDMENSLYRSGCSQIHHASDIVVTISDESESTIALVLDDAVESALTQDGWTKIADNVWHN